MWLARFYIIKPSCCGGDSLHFSVGGEREQYEFLAEYQALLDMLFYLLLITALHFTDEEVETHRKKLKIHSLSVEKP